MIKVCMYLIIAVHVVIVPNLSVCIHNKVIHELKEIYDNLCIFDATCTAVCFHII